MKGGYNMNIYCVDEKGKEVTFEELLEIQKQFDKDHEEGEE